MTPLPPKAQVQALVDQYHKVNGEYLTWEDLRDFVGFPEGKKVKRWIDTYAKAYGIPVRARRWPVCGNAERVRALQAANRGVLLSELLTQAPPQAAPVAPTPPTPIPVHLPPQDEALITKLKAHLKSGGTLDELAQRIGTSRGTVLDFIDKIKASGVEIHQIGDKFLSGVPQAQSFTTGRQFEYKSSPDHWYCHGVVGDTHLCSKYERLDVLNSLYDIFAAQGVDRVFHCGNMIDGYKPGINDHDVQVIGMDDQINYLVDNYPQRDGIVTYAVSGDDHEGWYAQKMGIDIGKRIEQTMREHDRHDWADLGYMEAHVRLVNAMSGNHAILAVVHPGGGSSYADSYTVQKIIESYEGGEKPAVAYYGHYHKQLFGEYRNVFWAQPGCTQDQTPFARKKKLRFVIGGAIVWLKQDPDTGAIVRFKCELLRYFNRGYYNDRWSHAGQVVLPDRGAEHTQNGHDRTQ